MSVLDQFGALEDLTPVGLDELPDEVDLQTRKDRKYLIPRSAVSDLIAAGGQGCQVLTIDDACSFRYESVYFDTPSFASYLGSARRRPSRYKVRSRSYLDVNACFLEVKTRDTRGRTVKHRHPYELARRAELTDDGRWFVATIDESAPAVELLRPTLVTSYRRATLVLPGGTARVTIDVDLAWDDRLGQRAELVGFALVETKTAGASCAFDRTLWHDHHRPVTISKYCTGLAALHPELPANKWNRVLRRHFCWRPVDRD